MLDQRVEDNAEEIKKIKEALLNLAETLDSVAWRTSNPLERGNINSVAEIRAILKK